MTPCPTPWLPSPVRALTPGEDPTGTMMADPQSWPPGWFPDPTGRHDHRWWDGAAWTAHVADSGVAAVDPLLDASSAAPRPASPPAPRGAPVRLPDRRGADPVAFVALVAASVGLLLMFVPVLGLVAHVVAVVLGLVARSRIRSSGRSGRGAATSSMVVGGIGLALSLVITVTSVALLSDPDSELTQLFRDYFTCIETRSTDDCQRELEAELPGALRRSLG